LEEKISKKKYTDFLFNNIIPGIWIRIRPNKKVTHPTGSGSITMDKSRIVHEHKCQHTVFTAFA
jgi:hypothetical protein